MYFYQGGGTLPAIGSAQLTLSKDYWHDLCGSAPIQLYPVDNSLEQIVQAHQNSGTSADYITWKAVDMPYSFLGNPFSLRDQLERKATIRSLVDPALFPEFAVIEIGGLAGKDYAALTELVKAERLVIQVDFSTGGKGTYFMDTEAEYLDAYTSLIQANQDQRLVVSKRIEGSSFAVQCYIADKSVTRMDWWHKDLVGLEGLCSNSTQATKYCGAVLQNIPPKYLDQIEALTTKVGTALVSQGWRGIFGMDIVVEAKTDKVYLIEVNPRFTAVSHVYATAMHAVGCGTDFLTEGVRELVSQEAVPFKNLDAQLPYDYFYLKLQNIHTEPVRLNTSCKLGVYQNQAYLRFGFGIQELRNENEVVVIPEGDVTALFAPGDRMFSLVGVGDPTKDGLLTPDAQSMVASLRESFEVRS